MPEGFNQKCQFAEREQKEIFAAEGFLTEVKGYRKRV